MSKMLICGLGAAFVALASSGSPALAQTAKAQEYTKLAAQYLPKSRSEQEMIQAYMKVPARQRGAFKTRYPGVSKSIWDYAPYAVCFYASVAGGADVVEAGDECHDDWVN